MTGILRTSVFFIILFFGLIVIELIARNIYTPKTDLYLLHKKFKESIKTTEAIFLGSSHIERGINPKFIDVPAYNLAYGSQDFYYDYMIVRKYMSSMPKLKYVVLGVSYFSFYYDESEYSSYMLKDYYTVLGIMPQILSLQFFKNISVFLIHQDTFFKDVLQHKKPTVMNYINSDDFRDAKNASDVLLNNGYRFSKGVMSINSLQLNAKERVFFHNRFHDERILLENLEIMKKLLSLLENRNIKIIMITTPYTSFYRESFSKEIIIKFYKVISQLCEKHPHIEYMDYSDSPDFNLDDFLNSDHLNYKGAEKLSKKINKLLHTHDLKFK
jgi:hypothetical protein